MSNILHAHYHIALCHIVAHADRFVPPTYRIAFAGKRIILHRIALLRLIAQQKPKARTEEGAMGWTLVTTDNPQNARRDLQPGITKVRHKKKKIEKKKELQISEVFEHCTKALFVRWLSSSLNEALPIGRSCFPSLRTDCWQVQYPRNLDSWAF